MYQHPFSFNFIRKGACSQFIYSCVCHGQSSLPKLVQQIADDKGFTVHLFECGEGDHVHCFVSAPE